MANSNQALDPKGIHREMHGIVEQIKVINKLNARLVQQLIQTPALATIPIQKGSNQSYLSH